MSQIVKQMQALFVTRTGFMDVQTGSFLSLENKFDWPQTLVANLNVMTSVIRANNEPVVTTKTIRFTHGQIDLQGVILNIYFEEEPSATGEASEAQHPTDGPDIPTIPQ